MTPLYCLFPLLLSGTCRISTCKSSSALGPTPNLGNAVDSATGIRTKVLNAGGLGKKMQFPNCNHVPWHLALVLGRVTRRGVSGSNCILAEEMPSKGVSRQQHPQLPGCGIRERTGGNKSTTAVVPQAPGPRNVLGERCAHPPFSIIRNSIWWAGVRAAFLCLPCFCSRCE